MDPLTAPLDYRQLRLVPPPAPAVTTLQVEVRNSVDATTVVLRGDLDMESHVVLTGAIDLLRPFRAEVVIDLTELEFLDSSGLRALYHVHEAVLDDTGQKMTLVGCRSGARQLFEVSGLDAAFRIA